MQQALLDFLANLGVLVSDDALLVIVATLTFLLGLILANLWSRRQQHLLQQRLTMQHSAEQALLDDQIDQLSHTFSSLSQQALRQNNDSFLMLAQQSFVQLQANASNDLKARETSFANLIKPIQQSIEHTDQQLKRLDTDRKVSEVRLSEQIGNLLNSQHALQTETRSLVTALRRPEVRGQWGELTLKRLVELAGMSEHCDFTTQVTIQGEQGLLRPDMLIHLPGQRQLVVDVKTPLDAYLSANEASDTEQQINFLKQHSRNVKQRITELGQKQYWQQFEQSPEFVVLFIPGDQFLSAALEQDTGLLEYALKQKILLATPTSLVGLLRTIAYGWNQQAMSKNSKQIREIGETLYQRLSILAEHINKLGKNLDQSLDQFNKLVGSFESNALPAARKLSELGVGNEQSPIEVAAVSVREARHAKDRSAATSAEPTLDKE